MDIVRDSRLAYDANPFDVRRFVSCEPSGDVPVFVVPLMHQDYRVVILVLNGRAVGR